MDGARPGSVAELLDAAERRLASAGVPDPRLDAEWMLADVLATDRGALLFRRREVPDGTAAARFEGVVTRRQEREPLQHILGSQEFRGLTIEVDGRALIPRPETEGVVQAVLDLGVPSGAEVADLGTGTGCIAIALAVERPDLLVRALDASLAALEVAGRNVRRHGLAGRIDLVHGDLACPPEEWRGMLHAVVSNPPYVPAADWSTLEPEVRDHDPRSALVPGPTGLEAYRALAPAAKRLLRPGGALVLELGYGQAGAVSGIVADAGFERIAVAADLRGVQRVLSARLGAEEGASR